MAGQSENIEEIPAREKILQATLDLIPDWGADRITHRLVSAQAGVSPGTITYHFDTIDVLLSDAFRLYMSEYEAGLDGALTARPVISERDVVQFLMMLVATDPERAELARIEYAMIAYAQRDEFLQRDVNVWARLLPVRLVRILERLGHPAPRDAVDLLTRYCRGVEFDVLAQGKSVDLVALETRLLGLLQS